MNQTKEKTIDDIVESYIDFVKKNNRLPNRTDLHRYGFNRDKVRYVFGNMSELHEYVHENHSKDIEKHLLTHTNVFSNKNLKSLDAATKHNRFVVTTVVNGKKVDEKFFKSITTFCEKNDAKLLLLPCADVKNTRSRVDWNFDPILKNQIFVTEETKLNNNLFLSNIMVSAKQIKPTTGLARIGQRHGSYIFASPKQFLEYVITSPDSERLPHALMTTGALTVSDYSNDYYMSQRTSYIADNDHVMGAVIVETEDDRIYHFRQVQADEDGCFIDLCTKYMPEGIIDVESTLVLGDYHAGQTSDQCISMINEMVDNLVVRDIIVHDFFDGHSINHHDIPFPLKLARKAGHTLEQELELGVQELNYLTALVPDDGRVILTRGNHDEFLERWLEKGTFMNDPTNMVIGLELAKVYIERGDVLRHAYEMIGGINNPEKIMWLGRKEELKIAGVEVGQHGDLGLNGAKSSLQSMERVYGNCVVAHTHSAAIFRGVWRVGTMTNMDLGYNRGPSNWTHTNCLVYDNGQRQLINLINDTWKM